MRGILKQIGKWLACGTVFAIGLMFTVGTVGYATTLSLRTGPMPAADILSVVNTLVNDINTCCAAGGSGTIPQAFRVIGGTNGRIQFLGSGAWTANGTTATTMTSLGPTGSRTTIQRWLTVEDNVGNKFYIPAY